MLMTGNITVWEVGLTIGFLVVVVAVMIVVTILYWASRIADQAQLARETVGVVLAQTTELHGVPLILDSGVRILHSVRAVRKVAVGK